MPATVEVVDLTKRYGKARGCDDVSFDVPFKTKGSLTREQLTKLGTGALPIPIPTALPKLPF